MDEEAKDQSVLSKLKSKDALVTETLLSINQSSSNIMKFLKEEKLLCQHSFKQYLALEDECTASLTNYANKQFEQVTNLESVSIAILFSPDFIWFKEYGANGTKFWFRNMRVLANWTKWFRRSVRRRWKEAVDSKLGTQLVTASVGQNLYKNLWTVAELNLYFRLPLSEEDRIVNETEALALKNALDLSCRIFSALVDGSFTSRCLIENR